MLQHELFIMEQALSLRLSIDGMSYFQTSNISLRLFGWNGIFFYKNTVKEPQQNTPVDTGSLSPDC